MQKLVTTGHFQLHDVTDCAEAPAQRATLHARPTGLEPGIDGLARIVSM